jgi:23S rRNA (uracil1939-C5)-methyltransferase
MMADKNKGRQQPASDQPFELEMEAMANGGSAMGWHENRAVFVPFTIPGERILARITDDKGRFAHGEGVKLLDASTDRVFPRCAHFGPGKCGHCIWQHIDYPAQLLLKQDVLADQLARIAGLDDADVQPLIPSPEQWAYNFHMTMIPASDGKLGFYGVDGRHVETITECHTMHPDLLALYDTLDLDLTGVRRVKLQIGTDGAHMLILTMKEDAAPELETDMATSVNLILPDNEPMNLIGDSHSNYIIGGNTFRVTAGSFFRANVGQLPNLADTVLRLLAVQSSEAVLDLYAGVGFFSAFSAPAAGLVTMIESYPPAVTDADENLAAFDNVDVIEGGVDDVLASLEDSYEVAIVDPPSEGLSDTTVALLAQRGVQRLAYVSGDAAALAHDCKRLTRHGYRLVVAQPIDLAPQTHYIDTVALFAR